MNHNLSLSKTFPITVVKTIEDENKFIEDCKKIYSMRKIQHKNTFCAIDLEFNMNWKTRERYIALMQIMFIFDDEKYHDKTHYKPIYILNPIKLSDANKTNLNKFILCSNVIKIFHGSDSLDYPHIYKDVLKQNKTKFIRFINSSVDTRFLCEISKRSMGRLNIDKESNRCSIYNALLDHNIINKEIFDNLTKISSKIDYNKKWIINELTSEQISYAAYDVMYLYDLLNIIVTSMGSFTNLNKNLDVISVVNRLYRFHMLNRFGILKISAECKNMLNEYHIQKSDLEIIDQKIMEKFLVTIGYTDPKKTKVDMKLDIYIEDVLSIDTIRKSILNCLRIYQCKKSEVDIKKVERYWKKSKMFKLLKGHETILELVKIIKDNPTRMNNTIATDGTCE